MGQHAQRMERKVTRLVDPTGTSMRLNVSQSHLQSPQIFIGYGMGVEQSGHESD